MTLRLATLTMFLLALPAPLVLAADPLGDDGGAGRDAAADRAGAVEVGPGTHAGRLFVATGDREDAYLLDAEAGTLLRLRLDLAGGVLFVRDPQDRIHEFLPGGQDLDVLLPETGGWLVVVTTNDPAATAQAPSYRLALGLTALPHQASARLAAGWGVLEAAWDGPARIVARATVRTETTSPVGASAGVASVRFDLVLPDGGEGWLVVAWAGSGRGVRHEVRAGPAGVELPGLRVEALPPSGGVGGVSVALEGVAGTVRAMGVSAGGDPLVDLDVASDAPLVHAQASGDRVATWDGRDPDATLHVATPTHEVATTRAHRFEAGPGFLGVVDAFPAGSLTDPRGGTRRLEGAAAAHLLTDPEAGAWTLRLDPGAREGRGYHLVGATAPFLGVARASAD